MKTIPHKSQIILKFRTKKGAEKYRNYIRNRCQESKLNFIPFEDLQEFVGYEIKK